MKNNYRNRFKKLWIIGVDAETGTYTPAYVNISNYRKETGFKTVVGFQSYKDCLKVCQARNEKGGVYAK